MDRFGRASLCAAVLLAEFHLGDADLVVKGDKCKIGKEFLVYEGQQWKFNTNYDCYGGDLKSLHVGPSHGKNHSETQIKHLKTRCAMECIDLPACTGFNFPKGDVAALPKYKQRCFLKSKGDESWEKAMQCDRGRVTPKFDYFTLLRQNCSKGSVKVRHPLLEQSTFAGAEFDYAFAKDSFQEAAAGVKIAYSASAMGEELPDWLDFNGEERQFAGTPSESDIGTLELRVIGEDDDYNHASARTTFKVNVLKAPVVSLTEPAVLKDQVAFVKEPFEYKIPSDVFTKNNVRSGQTIVLKNVPEWLDFDVATLTLSGTPAAEDVGGSKVTVVPAQPFPNNVAIIPGVEASFQLSVWTGNNNDMTPALTGKEDDFKVPLHGVKGVELKNAPSWAKFDPETGEIKGTPTSKDVGSDVVKVVVGGKVVKKVTMHVDGPDDAVAQDLVNKLKGDHAAVLDIPNVLKDNLYCAQSDTLYEPMNMNNSELVIYADNVTDCQDKCRATAGCGFFSWYGDLKLCHQAMPTAVKQTGRPGFVGGPAMCKDAGGQGTRPSTVDTVMLKRQCMHSRSYEPFEMVNTIWPNGRPATYVESALLCQKECKNTDGCEHFVYNTLTKACNLQDDSAKPTNMSTVYDVSGPKTCKTTVMFQMLLGAHAKQALKDNYKEFVGVVGILEAALTKTVGNYTPFDGGVKGDTTPLLTPRDIHYDVQGKTDDENPNAIVINVILKVDPSEAFYLVALLQDPGSLVALRKNTNQFWSQFAGEYAPKLATAGIKILNVRNAHLATAEEDEENEKRGQSLTHEIRSVISGLLHKIHLSADVPVQQALPKPGLANSIVKYTAFFAAVVTFVAVAGGWLRRRRAVGSAPMVRIAQDDVDSVDMEPLFVA